jgi:hypothetical protein
LNAQPVFGRLFNHFNWGGYLIGHLYPRYLVSMDGRTGVYGDENLRQYRATEYLESDWRAFLDRCDPDIVLWKKDGRLVRALELLPEWRQLYEDDVAVIFIREPAPQPCAEAAQEPGAAAPAAGHARPADLRAGI